MKDIRIQYPHLTPKIPQHRCYVLYHATFFFLGLLFGFQAYVFIRHICSGFLHPCQLVDGVTPQEQPPQAAPVIEPQLVLVAIMTTDNYLENRGQAIFDTWFSTIHGDVKFFTATNSNYSGALPVIKLPTVAVEKYPPQEKSLKMLKYLHDNYIDNYEFFVRADDDVYISGSKLAKLLNSVDSRKQLYIGQGGSGMKEEMGNLGIDTDEMFCMGGPGVVLSRRTLQDLAPYLEGCVNHVATTHEDSEVGRCIMLNLKLGCTKAYEWSQLFHQNYRDTSDFFGGSYGDEERNAITLHPFKNPSYMYKMQNFLNGYFMENKRFKRSKASQMIQTMDDLLHPSRSSSHPEVVQNSATELDDLETWRSFDIKNYESHTSEHLRLPVNGFLDTMFIQAATEWISQSNQKQFVQSRFKLGPLRKGYSRVSPLSGLQMHLLYQPTYESNDEPKHRSFWLAGRIHQSFRDIEFLEGVDKFRPFSSPTDKQNVNFVVPLLNRYSTLVAFLLNYIKVQSTSLLHTTVHFLLYSTDWHDYSKSKTLIQAAQAENPKGGIYWHDCSRLTFSRGAALHEGTTLFSNDSLMFFIDVDMVFTVDFIRRIRQNTILGKQLYFPVCFIQYSPKFTCGSRSCQASPFTWHKSHGQWKNYGFGMVGVYKKDYLDLGGLDYKILGWGQEDVNFYESTIKKNMSVFRSAEPNLVHLYHDKTCRGLPSNKIKMCFKSKGDSWAPLKKLADMMQHLLLD